MAVCGRSRRVNGALLTLLCLCFVVLLGLVSNWALQPSIGVDDDFDISFRSVAFSLLSPPPSIAAADNGRVNTRFDFLDFSLVVFCCK